jgi:hypothetical protein
MNPSELPADGLLYNPDITTQAEIDKYREFYRRTKGWSLPAFEFWLETRPDVLKRYRANFVRETTGVEERPRPLAHVLAMLHHYGVVNFPEGVLYEIKLSRNEGATREEVLDTLALAFLNGNPWGAHGVATSSLDYFKEWMAEPATPSDKPNRWPAHWKFDPKAFDSGMDYSTPEASPADMKRLREWYLDNLGELPGYVNFLMTHRPGFLKAYRNRMEHAIRDALPREMVPYCLLNLHVTRGFHEGVRESVLMGKWLGMTRCQLVDAITWAYYGGMGAISVAEEAAGDLLRSMD